VCERERERQGNFENCRDSQSVMYERVDLMCERGTRIEKKRERMSE